MATTHFSGPVDSKAGFKVNGVEIINGSREVQLGTSTSPISHTVQTSHTLEINITSSSTSGSTSYEPILFSTKLTGVGQVGGRVKAYLETNYETILYFQNCFLCTSGMLRLLHNQGHYYQ